MKEVSSRRNRTQSPFTLWKFYRNSSETSYKSQRFIMPNDHPVHSTEVKASVISFPESTGKSSLVFKVFYWTVAMFWVCYKMLILPWKLPFMGNFKVILSTQPTIFLEPKCFKVQISIQFNSWTISDHHSSLCPVK